MLPLHLSTQVDAQLVFLVFEVQAVTQLGSEHIAKLSRIIIVSNIKILAAQTVKPQAIIQTEQASLVKSHTIRCRCPEIPVAATTNIITHIGVATRLRIISPHQAANILIDFAKIQFLC
jgi:hypothetical protein